MWLGCIVETGPTYARGGGPSAFVVTTSQVIGALVSADVARAARGAGSPKRGLTPVRASAGRTFLSLPTIVRDGGLAAKGLVEEDGTGTTAPTGEAAASGRRAGLVRGEINRVVA